MNSISADIEASKNTTSTNVTVGKTNYDNTYAKEDAIHAIIKRMYANSQEHHTASTTRKKELSDENLRLGAQLAQYGVYTHRDNNGAWYMNGSNELLYDKYKRYIYHTGGIVGGGDIRENEQLALLKDKEWVLSEQMVKNLTSQMDRIDQLSKAMSDLPEYAGKTALPDILKVDGSGTVNNVTTNNNSQPVEITIGDTIIQGNANAETVNGHAKVSRNTVNEIARILKIKL